MRNELTPTHPQQSDVIRAQLETFREDPSDGDLFFDLQSALQKAGLSAEAAEIAELRASYEPGPEQAAARLGEAAEAWFLLGHDEAGERDLRRALALDPACESAAHRLCERLMLAERYADAAAIMEAELAALEERAAGSDEAGRSESGRSVAGKPAAPARRAQRHRMVAQVWDENLGRIDRALHHWRRAWELEPERTDAAAAARRIYASLGDDAMVASLYEAEIEVLARGGPPDRRADLELELGRLMARRGDAMAAANHLEVAVRIQPDSREAREALAGVYASPTFAGREDRQRRASELFVELGNERLQSGESELAIRYLRRALGVDPHSVAATDALERALSRAERWDELDRLYSHRAQLAETAEERLELGEKRARLYDEHLGDREALKACLAELAAAYPPGNAHSARLRELYREDENWAELASLIDHETRHIPEGSPELISELLELATIIKEHLGEGDRAAEHLHRILSVEPGNPEALARYSDHFRERRDYRGLADLIEFSVDNLAEAGASPAELSQKLEELADVAETRLGDVDRAVATWRRIEEIDPHNPKPREALRRIDSRAKMWESLVGVLEQEAEGARGPAERAEALRRIAQTYRERHVHPRRAIGLYEEVLTLFPDDEGALKALVELYEREADDAGVAHTLRRQLDLDWRKVHAELEAQGQAVSSAREWPVAKRVERLTALRRLAAMYEQKLADVEGVVFACAGVLEIIPGDREALERMERVLEKAGDTPRLEQTLEYHAASATGPAERTKVLRRLARLADERGDDEASTQRWEQVLKAAPSDPGALEALAELYDRHERYADLAAVLERTLLAKKSPPAGSPAAAKHAADLKRYAQVVGDQLGDAVRATRAWHKVLEVLPKDRDALAALAHLHEEAGQWRNLAEILERQAPLYLEDDPDIAADIALRRAALLEERLGAPAEAIRALETLLRDLDPASPGAHRALRRLYESRGDFESAVRVAEREMYLADEDDERVRRGLDIGLLCRDRLGDATRALQAYERVLAIRPDHHEALEAAAELYAAVGAWFEHVSALEARLEKTEDERETRALMLRIAETTAERLGDPHTAFSWYRRAHEQMPDATTLAELRRAADAYGMWTELAEVYENERAALAPDGAAPRDPQAYVSACRELAVIAEHRIGDRGRSIAALYDALCVQPDGEDLLAEAERIAGQADETALWAQVVDCFDPAIAVAGSAGRVALHTRRARVHEQRLGDPESASSELLRAFAWDPERGDTRRALYELAERSGRWDDVLAVEAALFSRAARTDRRLEILRRMADVLEQQVGDLARAFRMHLRALLLAPDDGDTSGHLWRLARAIGRYEEHDRTPAPEPAPAPVESGDAMRATGAPRTAGGNQAPPIEAKTSRREATQELTIGDLVEADSPAAGASGGGSGSSPREQTMQLDLSDLVPAGEGGGGDDGHGKDGPAGESRDPTIELRTEDLIQALGGRGAKKPPSPPPDRQGPGRERPARKGPPPPPPPPPRIAKAASPEKRQHAPSAGRRAAPQAIPTRAYDSPWEELCTAYEVLAAGDTLERVRFLTRAAEVWELGAEDIPKAFETLARALEASGHDEEPKARLYRLTEAHGEWDRLAELYEARADDARTADEAASLVLEVAEIRDRQGRRQDTESLYRRVLGMRPDDAEARERIETLYREDARWVDLAASLEERTDPRLGSAAPTAERPGLLRELTDIYRHKLSRPYDAIEALERLRDLAPEDVAVLREIADLNASIGRWRQVVSALTRLTDVAEGTQEAREAYRRIAAVYEEELELPDRAIDAYAQIAHQWPDDAEAYEALDRLYEAHAKWRELAEVLARRASLSRAPAERAELLKRRAHILLEWLEQPDEAAAALRHARTVRPDDEALADDLVQALVRAGRAREAAAVLEGRLTSLRSGGASAGDLAAVLVRLAALKADDLDDQAGARKALDEALGLVPSHPTALSTLARLAESDDNPRAFAEAKLREAEALSDIDRRVEALVTAGLALRDDCGDIEGARGAFEQVLALRPYHSEATWALAGLVEQGGNLDSAAELLENKLEDEALDGAERARVLTQLAALAREAGMESAAERRLAEAFETCPTHVPAVIARADLLATSDRTADLESFLLEALPAIDDSESAAPRAELRRRLALAYERQDRQDEAYQTLIEADRLDRRSLPVKLALGENRYRARRWREASLHLSALAEHPDAERYPAEVAEGLYHAALAEIRSLRPEKAEPLYERALELKSNYAPALHALAELAMERGNAERAADLLTRQADATTDSNERLRLFEALGDMALMTLKDEGRAKRCFEAAVEAADPLESKHLPLLEKLLERQSIAGDHAGRARAAELMASFAESATERSERLLLAAESHREAGDVAAARSAAERAAEATPRDIDAVTLASELAAEAGDSEAAAAMLGRALSGTEAQSAQDSPRYAALWERLGAARLARGDAQGASAALEKAIAIAPDTAAAQQARRRLVDLFDGDPDRDEQLVDWLRALAADAQGERDIVRYARALCRRGHADGGRAILEAAIELDHVLSDPDRAFLAENTPRQMADDEAYRGSISGDLRAALIADPEDDPLAQVFSLLWEAAPLLWPDADKTLERLGITQTERIPVKQLGPAAAIFTRVAKALEAGATVMYRTNDPAAPDVQVVCASPPIVVLGPKLEAKSGERPPDGDLRFILGRAAELTRPERIVTAGLPEGEAAAIVASLARMFGDPESAPPAGEDDPARDELIKKALPVKLRTHLGHILGGAGARELDPERYRRASERAADRAGLLVCGDLAAAARHTRARLGSRPQAIRHLIETTLAPSYLDARATLGVGVRR